MIAKSTYLETFVNGNEESITTFSLEDGFLLFDDDPLSEGARVEKKS